MAREALTGSAADPVAEPDAYRALLLGRLGTDDPAVVQAESPERVASLAREAAALLRTRPAPEAWSALECLGHLVDGELVVGGRVRWILAEDQPDIVGYDQDRWVARLHRDDDPAALAATFTVLRAANLRLWASSRPEDRARIGIHRERGPESYELTFRLLAGHDRVHLDQAERALATVRAALEREDRTA